MLYRTPLNDPKLHAAGGAYAATTAAEIAANYPSVAHFFPCNETSGAVITDLKAGATMTSTGDLILTTSNAIRFNATGQTSAGTWLTPSSSPFMVFAVLKGISGGGITTVRFGTATGNRINLNLTNPSATDATLGATATGTNFTLNFTDTIYGRANVISAYNSATGQSTYECDSTGTINDLADTTTAGAPALTSFGQLSSGASGFSISTNNPVYGILFCKFTSAPTAAFIKAMISWQTYQWAQGNKWLYPGLKGVA